MAKYDETINNSDDGVKRLMALALATIVINNSNKDTSQNRTYQSKLLDVTGTSMFWGVTN